MDAGADNKMKKMYLDYAENLKASLDNIDWTSLANLSSEIRKVWREGKHVFICGNGGSAANAMHIANDFIYGISPSEGGLKVEALTANTAVLTCLANDLSFEEIFSHQLHVKAVSGDLLICLSGSGNSPNILRAIEKAKTLNVKTFGILGYDGGKALNLVDHALHFQVNDMQIAEDLQLIIGHMLMKDLMQSQLQSVGSLSV